MLVVRALLVTLASALLAGVADAAPEPIRVSYAVPDGCPDEVRFVAGLEARARIVRTTSVAARLFAVAIETDADGHLRGALTVTGTDSTVTRRDVAGATCAELVDALQLVAALAIEEQATRALQRADDEPVAFAPPRRSPWYLAVGAGVERYTGMTPGAVFGVPVHVALGRRRGPSVRVTFARTQRDDGALAGFRWTAGRVEGCPWALGSAALHLAPCAGLDAGVLDARGATVAMPLAETRPWLAPEATARLHAQAGRFALELEATLAVPIVRDRFFIAPNTTVHRVSALTTGVGINLSVDLR